MVRRGPDFFHHGSDVLELVLRADLLHHRWILRRARWGLCHRRALCHHLWTLVVHPDLRHRPRRSHPFRMCLHSHRPQAWLYFELLSQISQLGPSTATVPRHSAASSLLHNRPETATALLHDRPATATALLHDRPATATALLHDRPATATALLHDRPTDQPSDRPSHARKHSAAKAHFHSQTLAANPVHPKSGLVRKRSSALKKKAFLHGPGTNGDPDKAFLRHSTAEALPLYQANDLPTALQSYRKTTDLLHSLPTCSHKHAATDSVQHAFVHAVLVKKSCPCCEKSCSCEDSCSCRENSCCFSCAEKSSDQPTDRPTRDETLASIAEGCSGITDSSQVQSPYRCGYKVIPLCSAVKRPS